MRTSVYAVGAMVLLATACGPDASAELGGVNDVDGLETSQGELTSSSGVSTWFPMQEGNSWTFATSTGERTVTLARVQNGMGVLTGLFAEPTWVGVDSSTSNTLYAWNGTAWNPLFRFGYAVSSWKTGEQYCSGFKAKRISTGTSITTGAGVFTDTRTIGFEQNIGPTVRCSAPVFRELGFAAGVGFVSIVTGQEERQTLVRARINGKTIAAAKVSATLTLDRSSYVSKPNTIRCITAPCPTNEVTAVAQATFTIRNTTSTAVTYQFRTGCQLELQLVDANNRVLRSLSEGRFCTQALTSVGLAPGESKTFRSPITLADNTGIQLEGAYTARASLVGYATAPVATSAFSVRIDSSVP